MSKAHAYLFNNAEFDRFVELRGFKNTKRFCEVTGFSRSTLQGWRAGATCPTLENVGKLMDWFPDLPMEQFLIRNPAVVTRGIVALSRAA
jgi:hypothetical protein